MCCSLEISARAELYMKGNARYREVVWWMMDFDIVLFSLLPITKDAIDTGIDLSSFNQRCFELVFCPWSIGFAWAEPLFSFHIQFFIW